MSGDIRIVEGGVYWFGASSMPRRVWVVDAGSPVRYRSVPLEEGDVVSSSPGKIFRDLVKRGTNNRIAALRGLTGSTGSGEEGGWPHDEIRSLRAVLDGGDPEILPEEELYAFEIHVWPEPGAFGPDEDPWNHLDALTGGCCNWFRESQGIYGCTVIGVSGASELIADPRIRFAGISETRPLPERFWHLIDTVWLPVIREEVDRVSGLSARPFSIPEEGGSPVVCNESDADFFVLYARVKSPNGYHETNVIAEFPDAEAADRFGSVVAAELGVPFDGVRARHGDPVSRPVAFS